MIAACAVAAASAPVASASAPRARVGSVPRLPAHARASGAVRGSSRVQLTISLASRDPLGLQALATEVSTPGSAQFRHYLGVARFAQRFGATPAHVAAVRAALRAQGLTVGTPDADRLSLEVSGSAARVQAAFATRLARVRLSGGRVAYADRSTPTLPASVASDVDAVVGLNTLVAPESDRVAAPRASWSPSVAPRATGHVATGGPQPCAAASATAVGSATAPSAYTADSLAAAYDFSGLYALGDSGAGQTIALYELEQLKPADVAAYQACYQTAVPFSYVKVDHPRPTRSDLEAALDADQLIGLAPGAKVITYQAPDTAAGGVAEYAKIISQDAAHTVSVSWGACESQITLDHSDLSVVKAENKLFQEAAVQGQSILTASGDTGSSGCYKDTGSSHLAVQDPASQPYATAVGGTSLYTLNGGQPTLWDPVGLPQDPLLESVWNDGLIAGVPAASTGGISSLWAMPRYQSRAPAGLGVVNAHSSGAPCAGRRACREVPDVSADGDPATGSVIYATADGKSGWTAEGGTSAAAPLWSALTAMTDALPSCRGAAVGFENPSLYDLAAAAPGTLRDVTLASPVSGRIDNSGLATDGGLYPTTPGYDMTTGLGTPDAARVAGGLCGLRAPVFSVSLAAPRTHRTLLHTRVRLHVRGLDSGRLPLSYRATGLPKGLRISKRGVITGKARRVGSYTVTVTAVDHATNAGTVRFPITVVTPPPRLTKLALTGVGADRPRLAFTVTRGRYAPRVRAVTVRLPAGLTFRRHGRGVRLSAGHHRVRFHARLRHGALTLAFTSARSRVRVIIGDRTLRASRSLARRGRHHHADKVKVRINVTDRHRVTTRRSVRLRLKR